MTTLAGFLLFWSGGTSNVADIVFILGGLLVVCITWLRPSLSTWRLRSHHAIAALVLAIVLARFALPGGLMALEMVRRGLPISIAAIILGWIVAATWNFRSLRIAIVVCTAAATGVIALRTPAPPIDIYRVHIEAGRLLAEGRDPYTALNVPHDLDVPDVLVPGYSYPPINLLGYSVPAIFVDPRWTSVVSWVAVTGILGLVAGNNPFRFWLVMVIVTSPVVVPLLLATFTEPFMAFLLVGSIEWYRRHPSSLGALALGVAIGSKQHLPMGLPGQLKEVVAPDRWWLLLGAFVALAAGFIISPFGYLDATIWNLSKIEPNPLSASLYGLTGGWVNTPTAVAAAIAIVMGWLVARQQSLPSLRPVLVSSAVMLTLAANTTWNHWVLVGLLLAHGELHERSLAD